jgi:predicted RNase H-like HicB family nuclease
MGATMRKIIIHRNEADDENPFWVECPSLGIGSMGETIYEAFRMIYEVIALHIEYLIRHGYPVPPDDADTLSAGQLLVLDI